MTWTVLHDAVEHQRAADVICRARSNSEEAALVDDRGSTPLHLAVQTNPPLAVLRALIDANTHALTCQDRHGDTPLHVALKSVSSSSSSKQSSSYFLASAASSVFEPSDVDPQVIRTLLSACPTSARVANREGLMPIHVACRHCSGSVDIVRMLAEAYPSALSRRIKMGEPAPKKRGSSFSTSVVRPLEERNPANHFSLEESNRTTYQSTSDLRFRDLGRQVRDGAYPLHMAVMSGAPLSVLKILTSNAPDVLLRGDKHGSTPLHLALAYRPNETDVIIFLLSLDRFVARKVDGGGGGTKGMGAGAGARGKNLPLHVACMHGCHVDAIRALIEAYPEAISERNADGMTPLEVAEGSGKFDDSGENFIRLLRMKTTTTTTTMSKKTTSQQGEERE